MKQLCVALLTLALLAAGYWLYTAPQRAWRDLKQAADHGDEQAVYAYLDTAAVKESLTRQRAATLLHLLHGREIPATFADGSGQVPVSYVVRLQVARAVQPWRLAALLQGDKDHSFGQGDELMTTNGAGRTWADTVDISGSYDSVSRYTMRVADKKTHLPVVALTMRREGLTWKLVAVQLPLDEEKAVAD